MPFLPPNQQRQSTEASSWNISEILNNNNRSLNSFNLDFSREVGQHLSAVYEDSCETSFSFHNIDPAHKSTHKAFSFKYYDNCDR